MQRLIAEQIHADAEKKDSSSDVEANFIDNNGDMSVDNGDTSEDDNIFGESSARAERDHGDINTAVNSNNEVSGAEPPGEISILQVGDDSNKHPPPAWLAKEPINLDVDDIIPLPFLFGYVYIPESSLRLSPWHLVKNQFQPQSKVSN